MAVDLPPDPAQGGLREHVPDAALAGDEDVAVGKQGGRHRAEIEVVGVVVGPARRRPLADQLERGAQLQDRIALVPGPPFGGAVAGGDEDVAVGPDHRATRRPDRSLPAGGHHEVEGRPLVTRGHGRHRPDVLVAVAVQAAEADVHVAIGDRHGRALLDGRGVLQGARDVHLAGPEDGAGDRIEVVEDVDRPHLLGHHKDRLGGRVVGRGAGHAEREDVPAAEEVGLGHRRAHMVLPHHRPGGGVERVEGVVLGGDDHVAADDDRLRPHRTVQVGAPFRRQGGDGGRGGGLAGALRVLVVDGPGGGEGWGGRRGGDWQRGGGRRSADGRGGDGGGLVSGARRAGRHPRRQRQGRGRQGRPRAPSGRGHWRSPLPRSWTR